MLNCYTLFTFLLYTVISATGLEYDVTVVVGNTTGLSNEK